MMNAHKCTVLKTFSYNIQQWAAQHQYLWDALRLQYQVHDIHRLSERGPVSCNRRLLNYITTMRYHVLLNMHEDDRRWIQKL